MTETELLLKFERLEERIKLLEDKPSKNKFTKPTLPEAFAYMRQKLVGTDGFVQDQSSYFINHYEANGWKVGRVAMKDWKAAIRNWVSNIKNKTFNGTNYSTDFGSKSIPVGNVPKGGFGHL